MIKDKISNTNLVSMHNTIGKNRKNDLKNRTKIDKLLFERYYIFLQYV